MPRDAQQIVLDRLLIRAAIADMPLKVMLSPSELVALGKYQKKITEDDAEKKFDYLEPVIKKLREKINTEDVAAKIKAIFIKSGALAQQSALELVYPQGPKLVIPVLAKIIEDLLKKVNLRKPASPATVAFVEAALAKVNEVDEKQNRNKARKALLLDELTKEKIRESMKPLIELAMKIDFHDDEMTNWFEAVLWIEGHFLREHNKALAMGKGKLIFTKDPEVVAPIDEEDETLCHGEKALGIQVIDPRHVTKHFVNSHFHALAVLLEKKIKCDMKLDFVITDVFPTSIVKQYSPSEPVLMVVEKSEKAERAEKKEEHKAESPRLAPVIALPSSSVMPYEARSKTDGRLELKIILPGTCSSERIAEAMRFFTKSINGEAIQQLNNSPRRQGSLLSRLKSIENEPKSELFSLMIIAFKQCELTGRENEIIHNDLIRLKNLIKKNYLDSWTTGSSGLWPRMPGETAHKKIIDEMWSEIAEQDDTGKPKTALEIIEIIQAKHKKALDVSKGSLPSALESLVHDICKHFIKCLPVEEKFGLRSGMGGKQ